ncbi:hypothetical protein SUNI508_10683 [Seiridium unicorne]|uniref:H15 domain-containing protein n=1 Tax=Seiridium unicorne TaxID=138068 RepID=A0ABR2UKR6_9PEZI
MPLPTSSRADASATPQGQQNVAAVQRTPNRVQINKILSEFASMYPDHAITHAALAKALRKLAAQEQQKQTHIGKTGSYLQPAASLTSSVAKGPGKRLATDDGDEINGNDVASPFKKIRVSENESFHVPLGEYNPTTPPRHISGLPDSQDAEASPHTTPPRIQSFTPINKPRARLFDDQVTPTRTPLPLPMRRLTGSPSEATPTSMRRHLGNDVPNFSSGNDTAHRKPAPPRLNLDIPGAVPDKSINEATHYVALPAFKKGPALNIDKLQQKIDAMQMRDMVHKDARTTLLKTPIYNLNPEDLKDSLSPFLVKPIPKTPASTLASAFQTKFTLATPTTAQFSAAARLRTIAAAQRAQIKITDQIGTAAATGTPGAYQHERRLRRTDRILGALNDGKGSSRQKELSKPSHEKDSSAKSTAGSRRDKDKTPFDLISALSRIPELAVAVAVCLPPRDVLTLYSVSVQFHIQVNTYLKSSITLWTREWAPHAAQVFRWDSELYQHFAIPDPAGRPLTTPPPPETPNEPCPFTTSRWGRDMNRKVPSIKWYQMVSLRDDIVIDILAHLARQGFRCPKGTKTSVLKLWMLMDLPTNMQRLKVLTRDDIFSDQDLLNIVIFMVKLSFRFNDPIYGPESTDLVELMLGQKSLYSLWQMLFGHNYRDCLSLVQCKIRYDLGFEWHLGSNQIPGLLDPTYLRPFAPPVLGVPADQIGRTHLEHWGEKGIIVPALLRPSQCVMAEAAHRELKFDELLMGLVTWGHVDQVTGRNLAPTEDEIWMRDSDFKNRAIDTSLEFTPFHCRKANWDQLDERARKNILLAQQVREERVYKWDLYRYDDPSLTQEENRQLNAEMRESNVLAAGVEVGELALRVDAEGNVLSRNAPVAATFTPGPLTARLQVARDFIADDGYGSDSTVDSLEAAMAVEDTSKLRYGWMPAEEDHIMHVPRLASAAARIPRTPSFGNIYDTDDEDTEHGSNADSEPVDGDSALNEDEEVEYENIWDMWEEMEPKVFRIIFDDSDDEMADV